VVGGPSSFIGRPWSVVRRLSSVVRGRSSFIGRPYSVVEKQIWMKTAPHFLQSKKHGENPLLG
jgi:hypothetical protein